MNRISEDTNSQILMESGTGESQTQRSSVGSTSQTPPTPDTAPSAPQEPPPKEEQKQPSRGSRVSVSKISQPSEGSTADTSYTEAQDTIELRTKSNETIPPIDRPQIIPDLNEKFMARPVQEVIRYVMSVNLQGKTFDVEKVREWCTVIADQVSAEVKKIGFRRYKHVVQVVIAERNGAGVKCGFKCLWDKDADGFTSDSFMNESLFCVVAVFGVYYY